MELSDPKQKISKLNALLDTLETRIGEFEGKREEDVVTLRKQIVILQAEITRVIKEIQSHYRYY